MTSKDSFCAPIDTRRLVATELLSGLDAIPSFELSEDILPALRGGIGARDVTLTPQAQAIRREQHMIPGPDGAPDVRVLVYTPPGQSTARRPAYLHLHGGGYVMGTPEINDAANRSLAAQLDCVIVAVAYRLAPETRFPGALEDAYAALQWLHAQAGRFGVDPTRIAIGGQSAGGGHAAALAIHARNRGEIAICLQLLDAPMLDDRTGSDPHPYCGQFIWTAKNNRFGWRALLGMEPGGADVPAAAVPARVTDLSGLPPASIAVGALDLFLEEDMEYARRLIRAGVPTALHVIPGAYHGFPLAGDAAPQVQAYLRWRCESLARAFGAHNESSG